MEIGIVAGAPETEIQIPTYYQAKLKWIGVDEGTLTLLAHHITPQIAIGDFDSISRDKIQQLKQKVKHILQYDAHKDKTDLELAIDEALNHSPHTIYFWGVTGGRLDHELINIQLLYKLRQKGVRGIIINESNWVEVKLPGTYEITQGDYDYISFLPLSMEVSGLTLDNFFYPLQDATVPLGSSLCTSNKLIGKKGTFSFRDGILIVVKSRDVLG
ncbi:thiamine diphosphokinase [Salirhabdus salicampi]|uniref:thiamine diphosphokinase n=1 Tax=Salirhabdus salicampi TaxID=476102 RepID=UPI0020C21CD5|nr:thiamine diphosphokinase [Salirhabdus salicampi]MCP8616566.1 thiamine diphosphokinase [Salirhabdus salicampi]